VLRLIPGDAYGKTAPEKMVSEAFYAGVMPAPGDEGIPARITVGKH
jgi:hypothetical protein